MVNIIRVCRALALITLVLIICVMLCSSVTELAYASGSENKFDATNVLDDLRSSTAEGKPFDLNRYPFDSTGLVKSPAIVNFVEYCYSFKVNMQSNYGLYLYFYNPQGLEIDTRSRGNKVQLAVKYDADGVPTDYEKFDLKFCSVSTEPNYYRLFYKFRIVDRKGGDGKTILQRVNSNERRYDVSGVELVTKGNPNAIDYSVGGTYKFTGYVAGYGPDAGADSTLKSDVTELETVSLDVRHANFRPGSVSSLGIGHQNELNSVYFSVPNGLLEKYGSLQKIKAEWYEYRTSPVVVLSDPDTYYTALPYVGKRLSQNMSDDKWHFYDQSCRAQWEALEGQYGKPGLYNFNVSYEGVDLPYLFYTGSSSAPAKDYKLSAERLTEYIRTYDKSFYNGRIEKGYSADLFEADLDPISKAANRKRGYNLFEIDAGDKYDLLSYDSTHDWWSKFVDFGLFGKPDTGTGFSCSAIQRVTDGDLSAGNSAISANLLIGEEYIDALKSYHNVNKADNATFLFRFAQSDYWSLPLFIHTPSSSNADRWGAVESKHGYVARENVYFDFDILQLTFNRDGVYKVIPVVSSPIDIVNGVTPPLEDKANGWWKIVLAIVLLVLLLLLFAPVLPYVFKFVFWLLCLPFRVLAALFKAIEKRIRESKERKEKQPKKEKRAGTKTEQAPVYTDYDEDWDWYFDEDWEDYE